MPKEEVPVNTPIFDIRSPKTRSFLRMMNAVKQNPLNIADFLDDRIPAMGIGNVDKSLVDEEPKGIKSDKEMQGAWSFMQMLLNRSGFGAMTPFETIELYRVVNDSGLAYKEANQIKRQIKVCKHEINKKVDVEKNQKELVELQEKLKTTESNIRVDGYSRNQRAALTQAVLIIGFIKEYVSLRKVRVENAEEQPVYIPLDGDDQTTGISIDKEKKEVKLAKGPYIFYATSVESLEQYPKAKEFVQIIKKKFDQKLRIGADMLDYIKLDIPEESMSFGYDSDPVTAEALVAMIKAAQPSPLITAKDVTEADKAKEEQKPAESAE